MTKVGRRSQAAEDSHEGFDPAARRRCRAGLRLRLRTAAMILALSTAAIPASATDGALDPSFNTAGTVFISFGSGNDDTGEFQIQTDGKIVISAGASNPATGMRDYALARLRADGTLDASFGTGGKVITDFGADDAPFRLLIQPDGKIVAAGYRADVSNFSNFQDLTFARYTPAGTLDSTFGSGGKVTLNFYALELVQGLALLPDGKILAAGTAVDTAGGGSQSILLVRLNANGSLDTTFGLGGKQMVAMPSGAQALVFNLLRLGDGRFLVCGSSSPDFVDRDPMIARFNANGTLDATFGVGGFAVIPVTGKAGAGDLALQADGKLVLGGYVQQSNGLAPFFDFAVWRLQANGALDSAFGVGGRAQTDFTGSYDFVFNVAVQDDGKILVAGGANSSVDPNGAPEPEGHLALARYTASGSLDPTFGTGGKSVFALTTGGEIGLGLLLQSDGKAVVTGVAKRDNLDVFATRHLLTVGADTSPCVEDATTVCLGSGRFAVSATFATPNSAGQAQTVRITPDTGYLWFFADTNVEAVVKVIDGCGLNQRFWVFAGGLTDVQVILRARDSLTGAVKTYTNAQGTAFAPIQDTGAFATCAANLASESTDLVLAAGEGLEGSAPVAAPAGVELRLNNNRFRVTATWRTASGDTGSATGVKLTSDTGYLWFFTAANVEAVIKVINGCGLNQRYWVFAGGLTDVMVDLTITDTTNNAQKVYSNPQGRAFRPIQDTGAFASCP
jgi:uncharacterized delta-60 repeat protein